MTRAAWKIWYRQWRIVQRECAKASCDMLIFGNGFVRISEDGFVNHVFPQAIYMDAA